ncbi:hypothetical protein CCHR01_14483 [Colletotrichum chrysophilum]|uniref:Uncharacterized protein n=1 Tax=Colletotrichum chrysophilum TaxID=1836956 RepID=A0AAD9E9J0_9PEZI|nr:hypothetical protein CCHR01_14483 [Colletotrichum chrysophilum]
MLSRGEMLDVPLNKTRTTGEVGDYLATLCRCDVGLEDGWDPGDLDGSRVVDREQWQAGALGVVPGARTWFASVGSRSWCDDARGRQRAGGGQHRAMAEQRTAQTLVTSWRWRTSNSDCHFFMATVRIYPTALQVTACDGGMRCPSTVC